MAGEKPAAFVAADQLDFGPVSHLDDISRRRVLLLKTVSSPLSARANHARAQHHLPDSCQHSLTQWAREYGRLAG